jgi:hypothetical protein
VQKFSAVPFLLLEARRLEWCADLGAGPQLWVSVLRRGATIRAINRVPLSFSSVYLTRKVLSGGRPLVLNADAFFWLGATGFSRVAPYVRCSGSVPYLAGLSVVLRECLGLDELGEGLVERGADTGAELVNIRYKQRVLMQRLRFTLFTLSGNVPHMLSKHRFLWLAGQVGRGYLLQRCAFSTRMLLRCSKLIFRRVDVAYLLHGGYVLVNGRARAVADHQLCGGDCLQMVVNRAFFLYLLRG